MLIYVRIPTTFGFRKPSGHQGVIIIRTFLLVMDLITTENSISYNLTWVYTGKQSIIFQ